MAGSKLSPRQKMINLMYLVFIAMLAMQVSTQVLSAFGYFNEKVQNDGKTRIERNQLALESLSVKAQEQPDKYKEHYSNAKKINRLSKEFIAYLNEKKALFLKDYSNKKDYEAMSKSGVVDTHFFIGDGYTQEGQEFLDKIAGYRKGIIAIIGENSPLAEQINKRFDTSPQQTEGGTQPWLNNRYEGFPLVSTITNLSSMIDNVAMTETEVLENMVSGQLESDVSMTNYKAILIPEKTAFFQGENFKGRVVLGRYDASLQPTEVVVNRRKITNIQDGAAILDFPAGSIGERSVKGKFVFMEKGKPVEIPIDGSYAVIPKPNSAVVSADKMNVVYRGISNPMTISIPGIPDNLVKVSAPGLSKAGKSGKYIMRPGGGKTVTINVSGTLPNGTVVHTKQQFRIKPIPSPVGTIRRESGYVKMPKSSLERAVVGVEMPDFDFDLKFAVQGFTLKVPGQSAVVVRGTRMSVAAQRAIQKARRGDVVTIFDIKSSIVGNSQYRVKKATSVSIEIR
ncbi:MAG: gliding motility protein GldM [Flavobacteriaceae bacterium]|nr:gliding motility protein GldM [Flavobacteriaceae bacterium]